MWSLFPWLAGWKWNESILCCITDNELAHCLSHFNHASHVCSLWPLQKRLSGANWNCFHRFSANSFEDNHGVNNSYQESHVVHCLWYDKLSPAWTNRMIQITVVLCLVTHKKRGGIKLRVYNGKMSQNDRKNMKNVHKLQIKNFQFQASRLCLSLSNQ